MIAENSGRKDFVLDWRIASLHPPPDLVRVVFLSVFICVVFLYNAAVVLEFLYFFGKSFPKTCRWSRRLPELFGKSKYYQLIAWEKGVKFRQPGKRKHFQTITLSPDENILCDCPWIGISAVCNTRPDLVCEGGVGGGGGGVCGWGLWVGGGVGRGLGLGGGGGGVGGGVGVVWLWWGGGFCCVLCVVSCVFVVVGCVVFWVFVGGFLFVGFGLFVVRFFVFVFFLFGVVFVVFLVFFVCWVCLLFVWCLSFCGVLLFVWLLGGFGVLLWCFVWGCGCVFCGWCGLLFAPLTNLRANIPALSLTGQSTIPKACSKGTYGLGSIKPLGLEEGGDGSLRAETYLFLRWVGFLRVYHMTLGGTH